jgi:hypothetical protein
MFCKQPQGPGAATTEKRFGLADQSDFVGSDRRTRCAPTIHAAKIQYLRLNSAKIRFAQKAGWPTASSQDLRKRLRLRHSLKPGGASSAA